MQKNSIKQFGERRLNMDNIFSTGISIEKMAAYLDGNLSECEMQDISSMIDSNVPLQQFIKASYDIDDALSSMSDLEMELPEELQTPDFEIPLFDTNMHNLVTLAPSWDNQTAIDCCNDSHENYEHHLNARDQERLTDSAVSEEPISQITGEIENINPENGFEGLE